MLKDETDIQGIICKTDVKMAETHCQIPLLQASQASILRALFGFKGFIYAQPATEALMLLVASSVLWAILRKEVRIQTP